MFTSSLELRQIKCCYYYVVVEESFYLLSKTTVPYFYLLHIFLEFILSVRILSGNNNCDCWFLSESKGIYFEISGKKPDWSLQKGPLKKKLNNIIIPDGNWPIREERCYRWGLAEDEETTTNQNTKPIIFYLLSIKEGPFKSQDTYFPFLLYSIPPYNFRDLQCLSV